MMAGNTRLSVKIAALVLILIAGLILVEGMSRVAWKIRYNQWLGQSLHGFDYVDQDKGLIMNKADIDVTLQDLRRMLQENNKPIGLKNLEHELKYSDKEIPPDSVIFRLNNLGLKGPDASPQKPDSVYRIMTIGNSCTWGPNLEYFSYPRVMERWLNQYYQGNQYIEVLNAGVLGYNYERVLKRISEWISFQPDLITIYLGWNRTIARADPSKNQWLYRNSGLYRIIYHLMINQSGTGLSEDISSGVLYNPDDAELEPYHQYSFNYDIKDLNRLITVVHEKSPQTKVVIITLAGLYDNEVIPEPGVFEKSYPVTSTKNLFAWSVLTDKYNRSLKAYADEAQIPIIDFEAFARKQFIPRGNYFIDSVHPEIRGYTIMGEFIARELMELIPTQ